jgi:uncharacterized membrane protein
VITIPLQSLQFEAELLVVLCFIPLAILKAGIPVLMSVMLTVLLLVQLAVPEMCCNRAYEEVVSKEALHKH